MAYRRSKIILPMKTTPSYYKNVKGILLIRSAENSVLLIIMRLQHLLILVRAAVQKAPAENLAA